MNKFSIIICTYNAAQRLPCTLEHLAKLNYPKDSVEIIVIDNNSSDGTSDVATNHWDKFDRPFSLTILFEKKQGKIHALKRGVLASKNNLMIICDDDNWLSTDYLVVANEIFTNNLSIGVLGGQGIPVTESNGLPNWFFTYAGGYATGVQAMESGDISSRGYVWGASSILRRDFLEKALLSGFDFLLCGRNGESLMSGEDSEICKWYLIAGYKLWYDERLVFKHFLPQQRLTYEYLVKLHQGFDSASVILSEYSSWIKINSIRSKGWLMPLTRLKAEYRYLSSGTSSRPSVVSVASALQLLVNG